MERRRLSAVLDADLGAISYLREAVVCLREEIRRSENRIDYYEALLGFLRAQPNMHGFFLGSFFALRE